MIEAVKTTASTGEIWAIVVVVVPALVVWLGAVAWADRHPDVRHRQPPRMAPGPAPPVPDVPEAPQAPQMPQMPQMPRVPPQRTGAADRPRHAPADRGAADRRGDG